MRVVKNEPTETTKGMNLELLMKQNLKPLNWPQYGQMTSFENLGKSYLQLISK